MIFHIWFQKVGIQQRRCLSALSSLMICIVVTELHLVIGPQKSRVAFQPSEVIKKSIITTLSSFQ